MLYDRRDFLRLAGIGGVVFASGLRLGALAATKADDFCFVQISDTHWGFDGPAVNPDPRGTLAKAVAAVNALDVQPDFVVFTGDLTHTTDDAAKRRDRLREFRDIAGGLKVKTIYTLPGEHDAAPDRGEAYQETFGKLHYSFDHKGVHFVAIDNVSDPAATVGEAQLAWMKADLAKVAKTTPVVVLTHRPLFDLYPSWDWTTRDGSAVVDLLEPFPNATVFYGHIHQTHFTTTGHVRHVAATSAMFPLPPAGSQPKRTPVPWDAASPYRGLGVRAVDVAREGASIERREIPLVAAAAPAASARVVKIEARRYGYVPDTVTLKRGVPVVLEVTSGDVEHGFSVPDLGIRTDVAAGRTARVEVTPAKTGTFPIVCDVYCGSGHEDMSGTVVVTD